MGNLTNSNVLFQKLAQGYGTILPIQTVSNGSTSTGNAADGFFGSNLEFTTGTSFLGTPLSLLQPPSTSPMRGMMFQQAPATATGAAYLVRLYKIGTLALNATGDQFTHDSATFPVTRTVYGVGSTAVDLIPAVTVSTAPATSAPIFQLQNVGGTTGYTNQAGNSVLGTKTITLPSATTIVNSTFIFRLEDGDSGVQDITSIKVNTAGTAGAAIIWGMEIIAPCGSPSLNLMSGYDSLFGSLSLPDMTAATPTSGTLTSYLAIWNIHGQADRIMTGSYIGVYDA